MPEQRLWLWWNGMHWSADPTGALAQKQAQRVGKHYLDKAQELERQAKDDALGRLERCSGSCDR